MYIELYVKIPMHLCNKNIHAFIDTQALHRCSSNTTGDSSKQYTYTGLNDGQTYWIRVVVTDNAGNAGKSAEDNSGTQIATPSANTNPYNLTTSAPTNLRTTTSLTITASATDNEQNTLYYDLYWNGSSTVTQTVQGTRGSTVTFTARTGLTKRTSYSWRIVVRDNVGGQQSGSTTSAYTNCPGNDIVCNNGKTESCTTCFGAGLKSNGKSYFKNMQWSGESVYSSTGYDCCVGGEGRVARAYARAYTASITEDGNYYEYNGWLYSCYNHVSLLNSLSCRDAMLGDGRWTSCSVCGGSRN